MTLQIAYFFSCVVFIGLGRRIAFAYSVMMLRAGFALHIITALAFGASVAVAAWAIIHSLNPHPVLKWTIGYWGGAYVAFPHTVFSKTLPPDEHDRYELADLASFIMYVIVGVACAFVL